MKILVGTNNKHKLSELQAIFNEEAPGKIQLVSPKETLDFPLDPEENGDTLEANAKIKAEEFHKASNLPSIADDTGLEIEALGGRPGVHSARFAGAQGDDAENRKKALRLMREVPDEQRNARFRTVICFAGAGGTYFIDGECRGKIIREERGSGGFGYDSIFVPDGFDKTFAELPPQTKNEISHRANAAKNFAEFLKEKFGE